MTVKWGGSIILSKTRPQFNSHCAHERVVYAHIHIENNG